MQPPQCRFTESQCGAIFPRHRETSKEQRARRAVPKASTTTTDLHLEPGGRVGLLCVSRAGRDWGGVFRQLFHKTVCGEVDSLMPWLDDEKLDVAAKAAKETVRHSSRWCGLHVWTACQRFSAVPRLVIPGRLARCCGACLCLQQAVGLPDEQHAHTLLDGDVHRPLVQVKLDLAIHRITGSEISPACGEEGCHNDDNHHHHQECGIRNEDETKEPALFCWCRSDPSIVQCHRGQVRAMSSRVRPRVLLKSDAVEGDLEWFAGRLMATG